MIPILGRLRAFVVSGGELALVVDGRLMPEAIAFCLFGAAACLNAPCIEHAGRQFCACGEYLVCDP
jgi:hypothetical protein